MSTHDEVRPPHSLGTSAVPRPRQEVTGAQVGPVAPAVAEFSAVHDAIRYGLRALADATEAVRLGDAPRINTLVKACTVTVTFIRHHHRTEDAFWWPAFRSLGIGADAQLAELSEDHEELEMLLVDIEAQCAFLRRDPTDEEALVGLRTAMAAVRDVLLEHLDLEEPLVYPLIAALPPATAASLAAQFAQTAPKRGMRYFFGFLDTGAADRQQAVIERLPRPLLLLRPLALRRYRASMARLGVAA